MCGICREHKMIINKNTNKLLSFAILVAAFFVFSAFKISEPQKITRYDFAVLVEDLLTIEGVGKKKEKSEFFKDLQGEKYSQILRTIDSEIMSGFPDKTFRPNEKLRNIETVSYLQKLSRLFFEYKPKSQASRQLMKLFAYQVETDNLGGLPKGVFPKKLMDSGEITERKAIEDVFYALKEENRFEDAFVEGFVVDAITNKPIFGAFVACSESAIKTDKGGKFVITINQASEYLDFFVACEGYDPLDVKKNITFDKQIELKLKPSIR